MRHDLEPSEQHEEPGQRAFPWYRVLLVVLLLILIGLQYRLWIADGGLAEVHRLQNTQQTLRSSVAQARTRNEALTAEVENLKSGHEAMAGRARTDIGMVKKGEKFFLTVSPDKQGGDKTVDSDADAPAAPLQSQ